MFTNAVLVITRESVAISAPALIGTSSVDTAVLTASNACGAFINI